jgi:hypothetical protein
MSEVLGVFFRDRGAEEYLVEAHVDEQEAQEAARARDERAFEQALEEAEQEGGEPVWEDYEGMHYVEPVDPTVVERVQEQLDHGLAVRID